MTKKEIIIEQLEQVKRDFVLRSEVWIAINNAINYLENYRGDNENPDIKIREIE